MLQIQMIPLILHAISVAAVWFGLVFQASSPNLEPSVQFKKARWLNLNRLFGLVWFWFGSAGVLNQSFTAQNWQFFF
jgi:hypothetical protein